jgi:hypothetical protein
MPIAEVQQPTDSVEAGIVTDADNAPSCQCTPSDKKKLQSLLNQNFMTVHKLAL